MATTRAGLLREALLALVVIALSFLSFGHTSAVFAANGRVVVATQSFCGDPLNPLAGDHFACHACRPDLAAVPPAPVAAEPACFGITPVTYAAVIDPLALAAPLVVAQPRGPPATA